MEIKERLLKDINDYCKLNGLDSEKFVNNLLKKAFLVEKYGDKPSFFSKEVKSKRIVVNYNFTCIFESEKEIVSLDKEEEPKGRKKIRKLI
jgi:hypothetical protein